MIVIERFEGDFAIVENDGAMQNIERGRLPQNAKEGDVIKQVGNGFEIDSDETEKRRKKIIGLQNSLWD